MTTTEQAPAQAGIGGEELENITRRATFLVAAFQRYEESTSGVEVHDARVALKWERDEWANVAQEAAAAHLALVSRLAELELDREKAEWKAGMLQRQLDRLVPCADHRDKVPDGECSVCYGERTARAIDRAAATPEGPRNG